MLIKRKVNMRCSALIVAHVMVDSRDNSIQDILDIEDILGTEDEEIKDVIN